MLPGRIPKKDLQSYLEIVKQDLTVASLLFERELEEIRKGVSNQFTARDVHETVLEDTRLYELITKGTRSALREGWRHILDLDKDAVNIRSDDDKSSYLHTLVNMVPAIYQAHGNLNQVIPIIYRLGLQGIRPNSLNSHGNTALHLACLRPHAQELCIHLMRIGADPSIANKKGLRVIHTYSNNKFALVKGHKDIKSGLWNAIKAEDLKMIENLMKTWCRVQKVAKNKTLLEVAEATSNPPLLHLLEKYKVQNEFVCAAMACDVAYMRELYHGMNISKINLNVLDYAHDVPKPLLLCMEELGDAGQMVCKFLTDHGAEPTAEYYLQLEDYKRSFEESQLYLLIEEGTEESILDGLDLISAGKVNLALRSHQESTEGWTYLHYFVHKFKQMKIEDEEKSRLLIRGMYRLALGGIDVHARDAAHATALARASVTEDQQLIRHLLRIGCDSSILDCNGKTVTKYIYEDRGKLVFDKQCSHDELPGLWVGIDSDDLEKMERWLRSWSRVKVKRGDHYMLDIVKAKGNTDMVDHLKAYEHINEFVCATFACDLKYMKYIIAMGKGGKKVNTLDEFFHVGYTWDRHAEYIARPVIITAMEICSPEVVNFLLKFGADLSRAYEELPPCGPIAFWAFREHVNNDNVVVVCQYADVELQDEMGCTLLHRAIQKPRKERKGEIVQILLDRGMDIAARDWEGSTARDYINIYDISDAPIIRQTIDDFVLNLVNDRQYAKLEQLLLDGYDHVLDITGVRRKHVVTARQIAVIKEYKEILELLDEWQEYRETIERLHEAAKIGDSLVYKISGEKKFSFSRDKAGRTLLHQAALYEQKEMASFLVDQYPHLINTRDNLHRIPLNLTVCTPTRADVWPILQDGGADPNLVDVNGYSNYDYVRELETPTPVKDKPRGRRWRDYRPQHVVEWERSMPYGEKAAAHELKHQLLLAIERPQPYKESELLKKTAGLKVSLGQYNFDKIILKEAIVQKREEVIVHAIKHCGARKSVVLHDEEENRDILLVNFAKKYDISEKTLELLQYNPGKQPSGSTVLSFSPDGTEDNESHSTPRRNSTSPRRTSQSPRHTSAVKRYSEASKGDTIKRASDSPAPPGSGKRASEAPQSAKRASESPAPASLQPGETQPESSAAKRPT